MRDSTLSPEGLKVFHARYADKDEDGNPIETFEQAVDRMAKAAASIEREKQWTEKFADAIGNLYFVPSTPIWANIGKAHTLWQPAACFVLDVEDSLESMYETLKHTALVFKSGGGVGYNFSKIRPKGFPVRTTRGRASGVVELIRLYDASSNMVVQGGVRRGASIGILDIDHPEILDFIRAKLDGKSLPNFNLSVGITDKFMEALENGDDWELVFWDRVVERIPAQELWNEIVSAAHACGDPGVLFLDTLQRHNQIPTKMLKATNPCGEQPLLPGESCLLGSINLARMVDENGRLKRELYEETIRTAVRFLDNIIDVGQYPLEFIAETTRASRKIGLGFTGLADVLIKANLAYDSEEGREYAAELTRIMRETAHEVSRELADERGCFPLWEESVYYPDRPMRNASLITIAPTGTVTVMAGCEGYGIEPIFAVAYRKKTNVAGYLNVFSPLFLDACKKHGVPEHVLDKVAQRGTCQVPGIPEEIRKVFKGAREISPFDHILMQAAVQRHVDNAVSKTINLPESAGVEDVDACFRKAHELGLKGITVFREGSKEGTVEIGEQKAKIELKRGEILPRPRSAQGSTYRLDTGCGKIYLTVNYHPDTKEILETFITTGSDGGCLIYTEATSRLVSLAIRGGISVQEIVEQLESTHSCPSYMLAKGKGKKVSPGRSCASAIARKLREIQRDLGLDKKPEPQSICPDCGSVLEHAEGCMTCRGCGFSKC